MISICAVTRTVRYYKVDFLDRWNDVNSDWLGNLVVVVRKQCVVTIGNSNSPASRTGTIQPVPCVNGDWKTWLRYKKGFKDTDRGNCTVESFFRTECAFHVWRLFTFITLVVFISYHLSCYSLHSRLSRYTCELSPFALSFRLFFLSHCPSPFIPSHNA